MEPDHVNETPSDDFTCVAAAGDIGNGPGGLDNHRQELLAERGQANQNLWLATGFEFCLRVLPSGATFAARDE